MKIDPSGDFLSWVHIVSIRPPIGRRRLTHLEISIHGCISNQHVLIDLQTQTEERWRGEPLTSDLQVPLLKLGHGEKIEVESDLKLEERGMYDFVFIRRLTGQCYFHAPRSHLRSYLQKKRVVLSQKQDSGRKNLCVRVLKYTFLSLWY